MGWGGINFLYTHFDTNPPPPPLSPSIRSISNISHLLLWTLQKQHAISDIRHHTLYTILTRHTAWVMCLVCHFVGHYSCCPPLWSVADAEEGKGCVANPFTCWAPLIVILAATRWPLLIVVRVGKYYGPSDRMRHVPNVLSCCSL